MASLKRKRLLLSEKYKAISYAQELQAKEFHVSNGWFERWKAICNVPFKGIAGKEKAETPEILGNAPHGGKRTCLQFCHNLILQTFVMLSSSVTYETKYSGMDQAKFVEGSL